MLFRAIIVSIIALSMNAAPALSAVSDDLFLASDSIRLSSNKIIAKKTVRIYATVDSNGTNDLRGVVKFLDGKQQIGGDQAVSIVGGKEDGVFVDWKPEAGNRTIVVTLVPFDLPSDDPKNNVIQKTIRVFADTDGDGVPDDEDIDDDNDKVPDKKDAFPKNRRESADSDGDGKGDNADDDDDNDGVKDALDAFPLNAQEYEDTDGDFVGNHQDDDDDGDGVKDLEEIYRGTNPLVADMPEARQVADNIAETKVTAERYSNNLAMAIGGLGALLIAAILAIYCLFSYSGRRASRRERFDAIMKVALGLLKRKK